MRKFNHWEAFKIVINVLYIASFIALIGFSAITAMSENGKKIVIQSPIMIDDIN